jgi:hypothetical protein
MCKDKEATVERERLQMTSIVPFLDHYFRNGNLRAFKSWIHLLRNQYRHFCYGKNVDMATWQLFISTKFSHRDEYRRKSSKVSISIAIVLSADF